MASGWVGVRRWNHGLGAVGGSTGGEHSSPYLSQPGRPRGGWRIQLLCRVYRSRCFSVPVGGFPGPESVVVPPTLAPNGLFYSILVQSSLVS